MSVQTSTTKEVLGSGPPPTRRRIRLRPDRRGVFLGAMALVILFLSLLAWGILHILGLLGSLRLAPAVVWGWVVLGLALVAGTTAAVVLREVLRQRALVGRGAMAVARVKAESSHEKALKGAKIVVSYDFTDKAGRRVEGTARVSRSLYSGERVLALFVDPEDSRNHILAVASIYELVI